MAQRVIPRPVTDRERESEELRAAAIGRHIPVPCLTQACQVSDCEQGPVAELVDAPDLKLKTQEYFSCLSRV
jgi:hypothetical protein